MRGALPAPAIRLQGTIVKLKHVFTVNITFTLTESEAFL